MLCDDERGSDACAGHLRLGWLTFIRQEASRLLRYFLPIVILSALTLFPVHAVAKILAHIDLSEQRMHLYVNGSKRATWPVSTARRGYRTPIGTYRPYWLHRNHYSTIYRGSPMPYSVFFRGGYAIHGTNEVSRLGRPVSHGCIRLHPANAAVLYNLIRQHGYRSTQIRITR
jgi:lipoprotein-anchoring transpeptidase ErfK/SrfK